VRNDETKVPSANRDPITGAPGAHPVGVGIGAAAGGIAAGAAAGTLAAGPVGTVVGAAIGAVAGGLGGKAIAEHYDPTIEEAHWRTNYEKEPYYQKGMNYDDYAPAYRVGAEATGRYGDQSFDEVEDKVAEDYDAERGASRLSWVDARSASHAAWNRVKR
jgi:phage tail tape-measure protein